MTAHDPFSILNQQGLSLIELLICLILIVLVGMFSLAPFSYLLERSRAVTSINWIVTHIHYTRNLAIHLNTMTTICPTRDGSQCGGHWHQAIMVFTDHNGDAVVNGNDRVMKRMDFPLRDRGSTLIWRAFRNKQYLQLTPMGYTNYQNGNFVYCSADRNPRHARQIVINRQGRVRKTQDKNGDGVIEDAKGKPLKC